MKNMKLKNILIISLVLIYGLIPTISKSQDAETILHKMDQVIFGPKDKQGTIKITVNEKNGREKVREAIMLQKGADKKLYRYTLPESQAGIATLSLPGDVMWLYMPAFGKPKKISLLAKSQAFNGTDFSYEDIPSKPYADRYKPVLLDSEQNTYKLELTPKNDKSQYSKILVTINKEHFYPEKMEYYDKKDREEKEETFDYIKTGGYWNAREVVMKDLGKGSSTKIELTNVKFDQDIPDETFTPEYLEQKPEK